VKEFSFSSDLEFKVEPADPATVELALRKFEADLNSKDPEVRHNAMDAISTTAPPYLQDVALRLARSKDVFDVAHGIAALRLLNTTEGNAALAEIVSSREISNPAEVNARCNAIKALGESGDATYLSMLAPYMEHEQTCESEAAMVATARLGQANAVNRLQSFLQNPSTKLRKNAAFALRWTVAPDAVDALIGALRDKDEAVRQQADASLVQLTGHSVSSADQQSGTPLQLEDSWRVWWRSQSHDANLVAVPPELCRLD
jgi:HEAT repeat protein